MFNRVNFDTDKSTHKNINNEADIDFVWLYILIILIINISVVNHISL